MKSKPTKKDIVWPIFAGLLAILAMGIMVTIVATTIYMPSPFISFLLHLLIPVVGGIVVGRMIKEKGWMYGGVLGIIVQAISILISSLIFVLPMQGGDAGRDLGYQIAFTHILDLILEAPRKIVLAAVGGAIGEYWVKSK